MSDSTVVSEGAVPAVPGPAMRRGRSAPVRWLCALAALAVCAGAAVVAAVPAVPAGAQQTTYTYELVYDTDFPGGVGMEGVVIEVGVRVTPPLPTPTQTEPTTLNPNPPIVYDTTQFIVTTLDGTAVNPRDHDDPMGYHRGDFLGGAFPLSSFSADPGTTPASITRTLPLLMSLDPEIEGDEYFELRVAPPTGGVDPSLFSLARPGADRIRVTIKDVTAEPVFKRPYDRHSVYLVAEGDTVTGTVNSTGLRSELADLLRIKGRQQDALLGHTVVGRDGSARLGVDYTAPTTSSGKTITAANVYEYGVRSFSVATVDDSVCQPTRSFTLAVTDTAGRESAKLTERSTATVYISEPSDTTDAPPAPPIYGVDQVSATSMKVRWGSAICADTYELAYKLVSGSSWTTVASGSLDSRFSHTVTGLTADTAYHVRVRAKNGTVNGAWSSVFTYAPPTAGKLTGLTLDDGSGTDGLVLIPRQPGIDGFRGARPELGYVVKVAPGTRSVQFTPTWSDANITHATGQTGPYGSSRYVDQTRVTSSGTRSGPLSIVNGGSWARIDGPAYLSITVSGDSATYNLWITPDEKWASADNYLARLVMTGSSRQSSPVNEQVGHSIPERRASDVVTLPAHSSAHGVSDFFGGYSVAASDGMSAVTTDASPAPTQRSAAGEGTVQLDGSAGRSSVAIDLSEPFDDERYDYTATVPNDVTSVTVNASPAHPDATVTVNGSPPDTPVALDVGPNRISIEVTAENGYQRTYTVVVTRQPLPPGRIDPDSIQTAAKRRRVTVAWDAPAAGGAPDGYIVHIRPQGGKQGSGSTKRVDADTTSVTFKRLEPGTAYKIWIRAHNSAAKGDRTHTTATTLK